MDSHQAARIIHLLSLLLLLLSGDVETNPGPPGRREPKPDPKKIMEEKVNSHDEKIAALEKLVQEQRKLIEEMGGKQKNTDEAVTEIRDDIQKIKEKLQGGFSQLGDQSTGTENKIKGLEQSLEEVQDKLWELDKSWENNLVFYGIKDEAEQEETSAIIQAKIRDIIKLRLGITREVQILRVKRSFTGTNVRGSKPVTVYFQKYLDKEEILRKSKLLAGSNIYIAEDFSKRVKDRRSELQKFMKKLKKRQPLSKFSLRYDKLLVDKDIYAFNESTGMVEQVIPKSGEEIDFTSRSSPTTPYRARKKSSNKKKNLEKSFSTDSALNHLVNGPTYEGESREPSPTKSISPVPEDIHDTRSDSKSRPGSPKSEEQDSHRLEDEESEIAANYAALNTYSAPLRKSNPDIPETITEDE